MVAPRPAILALDLGTGVLKAGLIGLDGSVLAASRAGYRTHEDGDLAEQDPEAWWRAIVEATAGLLEPGPRVEVVAVAVDGQGPTCVATAADGRAVRPAITWRDRRAVAEGDELAAATDLPVWLLGILPIALWLERHEPSSAAGVAGYLAAWEWVGCRLSGSLASTVSAGQEVPSPATLERLGIPAARVPEPVPAGRALGGLTTRAAAELGLPSGVPVVAGLNDAYASCLGAGLLEPGDAIDTGGSSGGFAVYTDAPPDVPGAWIATAPTPGRWLVGGAMAATGRALEWLRDDILGGDVLTETLLVEAAATPPGAEGLVFLPYLAGERSPIWDPAARGAFVGLTLRHGRGHLARAVLEAAAFALRHVAEPIRAAGLPVTELRVCGGPARSATWNRIKADVLGVPVAVPAVLDTAMLGAAILGAVGIGAATDLSAAIEAMVRIEGRLEPDPATREVHDATYEAYRALYPALRPIFHGLSESPTA